MYTVSTSLLVSNCGPQILQDLCEPITFLILYHKNGIGTSPCPIITPCPSTWLQLVRFLWNLILGTSMKICLETPDLVNIRQKIRHFMWRPQYTSLLLVTNICLKNIFVQHLVVSYCWQWHVAGQYTVKALLHFHCKSGYVNLPQCYINCTLHILFHYNSLYQNYIPQCHCHIKFHLKAQFVWTHVSPHLNSGPAVVW
jgi:hypothetical protein